MTRNELIEYLGLCIEAEYAIQEVNRMISIWDSRCHDAGKRWRSHKIDDIPSLSNQLVEPQAPELEKDLRQSLRDEIAFCEDVIKKSRRDMLLYLDSASFFSKQVKDFKKIVEKRKQELQEAERDYPAMVQRNAQRQQKYEADLAAYKKNLAQYTQSNQTYREQQLQMLKDTDMEMIQFYNQQKAEEEKKREALRASLQKLYGMNILHERFQNQMAVYQLKEYLEMGIADKLEGVDGAYRVYLEDLRTDRIVNTIDAFRIMVSQKLDQIIVNQQISISNQQNMMARMKMANQSLNNIYSSLEQGFNYLGRNLDNVNANLNQTLASNATLSNKLSSMESSRKESQRMIAESQQQMLKTVQVSAYNQYLIDRQNHVDSYLFRMLENPNQ